MGICGSAVKLTAKEEEDLREEKKANKAIEAKLANLERADLQVHKLLLLGAGESGKSTLFKQMISIYGKGFPESERDSFKPIIYHNILTSMKTLCKQSHKHGQVLPQNENSCKLLEDLNCDEPLVKDLAEHVANLWADSGIQATYAARTQYQLSDSTKYFCDKVREIGAEKYVPSQQDVLRSRIRTTGIVESAFEIEGSRFKMFDVGGQRNERKKWINCFENVTAVLFVAAISEYDQVLYEDDTVNRMMESLQLFEEMCNSRWFAKTSIILFLNKRDLFAEKIVRVPLTVCLSDYEGPQTYEAASQFVRARFESKNHSTEKVVYSHLTCATDTDNIATVFNAVKDIIIRESLDHAGLT